MIAVVIAVKDLRRSFRNVTAWAFMFGIPLLVTGMFYLMFGGAVRSGSFDLPPVKVVIANLDLHAPRLQFGKLPEGIHAHTFSELIVAVLRSNEIADLLETSVAVDAASAKAAVDGRSAQVAIIIPEGFSHAFAAADGRAEIEQYQDPTATIGPAIVDAVIRRFLDSLSGVKIAVDQAVDSAPMDRPELVGLFVEEYLASSRAQSGDPAAEFLEIIPPHQTEAESNPVLALITPIMGGMMIFYSYYTGVNSAQSILHEDEQRTLQRMFTTPVGRNAILAGKFLAVFLTVLVQVITLMLVARLVFGIEWGHPLSAAMAAGGIVLSAATFGILANSFLKDTRQSGLLFGGVLTVSGMLGMIRIFAMNSPAAVRLGDSVALLVPQGWAVRGLLEAVGGALPPEMIPDSLALIAWSAVFMTLGTWRFARKFT